MFVKTLKTVAIMTLALLLAFAAVSCTGGNPGDRTGDNPGETGSSAETGTSAPSEDATEEPVEEPTSELQKGFELHFIDVGTGDGMLLICDGEAMIIDSGNVGRGETMVNYAKAQGVKSLKYLMVTHGHADHVGGMPEIIDAFPFDVMLLNDVPCNEEPYQRLLGIIEERGITPVNPEPGSEWTLGGGTFQVIGPLKLDKTNLNNNSICIRFTYGEKTFLLCGDAQSALESQLLKGEYDVKADVFKADHHASSAGCTKKFLEAVAPSIICVQVGTENKLGYPDKSTVKRLEATGAEVFRNDTHGSIVVKSDGTAISVVTEKTPPAE